MDCTEAFSATIRECRCTVDINKCTVFLNCIFNFFFPKKGSHKRELLAHFYDIFVFKTANSNIHFKDTAHISKQIYEIYSTKNSSHRLQPPETWQLCFFTVLVHKKLNTIREWILIVLRAFYSLSKDHHEDSLKPLALPTARSFFRKITRKKANMQWEWLMVNCRSRCPDMCCMIARLNKCMAFYVTRFKYLPCFKMSVTFRICIVKAEWL